MLGFPKHLEHNTQRPSDDLLKPVPPLDKSHQIKMDSTIKPQVAAEADARARLKDGGVSVEPESLIVRLLREVHIIN